jgi:localization factor PodJL
VLGTGLAHPLNLPPTAPPSDDYIAAARRAALAAAHGPASARRGESRIREPESRRGLNLALAALAFAALGAGAYAWFNAQQPDSSAPVRPGVSLDGTASRTETLREDQNNPAHAGGPFTQDSAPPQANAAEGTSEYNVSPDDTGGATSNAEDMQNPFDTALQAGENSAAQIAALTPPALATAPGATQEKPASRGKPAPAQTSQPSARILPLAEPGELTDLSASPVGEVERAPLPPTVLSPRQESRSKTSSGQSRDETQSPVQTAAAAGNALAQFQLGINYLEGNGVPRDAGKAVSWLQRAAEQDLAVAQYRLGTLYEKGEGVTANPVRALKLYESAAQGGNRKAMHNLAVMHAEGTGTQQDFAAAAKWFMQAANLGLTDSQYNLAILYERGLGIESNLAEAYKWYAIAARSGDKDAGPRRQALESRLDADTLVKAKLAADSFKPRPLDPLANGAVRFDSNAAETRAPSRTYSSIGIQDKIARA